uniref:Cyclin K n=1 Tax=Sinocyclocheilus rhinocerous TaxID=307959 RepID=A0A673H0K8_9TELE
MKDGKENSTAAAGSFATNLDHTKPCWYWDKKDLAHTPSQSDGLDPATEARYRREGARFIFDVGTRLGLHYDTLATGITYFHRFYMFHSFKQFPRYVKIFLMSSPIASWAARRHVAPLRFGRPVFESRLVDLSRSHPPSLPLRFLSHYYPINKRQKQKIIFLIIPQCFISMFVCISSLCTMLSLQWETEIIAVAVMYLAGRLCKFDIQEWTSKQSSRRWWEQFVQDVPVELLEDICHQILDLYSQGKQPIPQQPQIQDKEKPPPPPAAQPGQSGGQNPPAQPPSKKNSPQASPPAKIKRQHVSKAFTQVGSKIPRLESPMPPLPVSQPLGEAFCVLK